MKVPVIILSVILILCAVGAAGILLRRNSDMIKLMYWHGKKKEIPPIRTRLPEIPYDAVLYSLNWGQSASNEYECFVFNLSCDEDGCYISGKYVVPENDDTSSVRMSRLSMNNGIVSSGVSGVADTVLPRYGTAMKRYTTKPTAAFLYAGKHRTAAVYP